jgi:LysR family transcriptional activator of mexEF-oprN operon
LASARPHLQALIEAALSPAKFDPTTSERTIRIGLSDANESWLLPPLLRTLAERAPRMQVIVLPVQFRNVSEALRSSSVDLAMTVVDDLPADTRRMALFHGSFVCLFDPRHARVGKRLTLERYLAHEHVIVSYNGDLRGIVEDLLKVQRRVRVSVPMFHSVGALVDGSALLATIPQMVAREITAQRPHLRTAPVPLAIPGSAIELLWRTAVEDDDAVRFVRDLVVEIARTPAGPPARGAEPPDRATRKLQGITPRAVEAGTAQPPKSTKPRRAGKGWAAPGSTRRP